MKILIKNPRKELTSLCLDYNINQFSKAIFEELKEQISLTHVRDFHLRQKMHNQFNMVDLNKLLDQYVDLTGITMHFYFDILYVDKKVELQQIDGKSFLIHNYICHVAPIYTRQLVDDDDGNEIVIEESWNTSERVFEVYALFISGSHNFIKLIPTENGS